MQNGFVESFNGRKRDDCLNEHPFGSVRQARDLAGAWRIDFNQNRPYFNPAGVTPTENTKGSKADQNLNRANPN